MKFTTQVVEESVQIQPLSSSWLGVRSEAAGLHPTQLVTVSVAGKPEMIRLKGFQEMGRNFSQVLFLNRKTSKSSREGGIWGEAGWRDTCSAFVPVRDFSLYILFIRWNFF